MNVSRGMLASSEAEPAEEAEVMGELDGTDEEAHDRTSEAAAAAAAFVTAAAARPTSRGFDLRRVKKLRGLLLTKYHSVVDTAVSLKWVALGPEDEEANDWHVTWLDTSVSFERVQRMGRLQKINHFPGVPPTRPRVPRMHPCVPRC